MVSPTGAQELPGADKAPPAKPVGFLTDIQPIFVKHCLKCHGSEKRSGGLRLDAQRFAASGGDSGKPILNGTLETNELYGRIASSERTYRMPKNADPLSRQEIERIKQWVEQGTPWPMESTAPPASKIPFYENWLSSAAAVAERYRFEYSYATRYAVVFLLIQAALLLVARAKAAHYKHRPWANGRARSFCKWCSRVTTGEMSLVWLCALAAGALVVMWGHQKKLEIQLASTQVTRVHVGSIWTNSIYGFPPVPIRPNHPKQVAGTYYRGNCERNPALFNNGNYLTAIFRVELCDSQHKAVQIGDPAPDDGLFVRVEIERAPGTADALFSQELMASVFFSDTFYSSASETAKDQPLRLETLEPAKRWVVYFPIGKPDAMSKLTGLIYLYTGRIENETVRGDPHYGIKYTLVFQDGKLTKESDLWMNSFGNAVVTPPELPGKIPYREWFDDHPIPAITGENSKDPKLLGLEEYIQKGLIKREQAAPSQQPPEGDKTPHDDE